MPFKLRSGLCCAHTCDPSMPFTMSIRSCKASAAEMAGPVPVCTLEADASGCSASAAAVSAGLNSSKRKGTGWPGLFKRLQMKGFATTCMHMHSTFSKHITLSGSHLTGIMEVAQQGTLRSAISWPYRLVYYHEVIPCLSIWHWRGQDSCEGH